MLECRTPSQEQRRPFDIGILLEDIQAQCCVSKCYEQFDRQTVEYLHCSITGNEREQKERSYRTVFRAAGHLKINKVVIEVLIVLYL